MLSAIHILPAQNGRGEKYKRIDVWFEDMRFSADLVSLRDIRRVNAIAKEYGVMLFVHAELQPMIDDALRYSAAHARAQDAGREEP